MRMRTSPKEIIYFSKYIEHILLFKFTINLIKHIKSSKFIVQFKSHFRDHFFMVINLKILNESKTDYLIVREFYTADAFYIVYTLKNVWVFSAMPNSGVLTYLL